MDELEIIKLVDVSKMSYNAVAKLYNENPSKIYRICKKHGVKSSHKIEDCDIPIEDIRKDKESGMGLVKLYKKYGVSQSRIKRILSENYPDKDFGFKKPKNIYLDNLKDCFGSPEDCYISFLKNGFVHPTFSNEYLKSSLEKIKKMEGSLNANKPSSYIVNFLLHFNKHYYFSTHKEYDAVSDVWGGGNKIVLKKAIYKIWNEKKKFNYSNLLKFISKHFRDFSIVSVFKPWVASYIYDRFLPDGGVVVDPCIGWGGRLVGCVNRKIKYVGSDLNKNSVDGASDMAKFLNSNVEKPQLRVLDAAKDIMQGDLLFTSPPYDNTELYYGINSYNTKTLPILENILKNFDNKIALNLPRRSEKMCMDIAKNYNRKHIETLEMKTASFMGREKTYEPILVFDKKSNTI